MKKKSNNKKKSFFFSITATQEFDICWEIEATSEKEAIKKIKKEFEDITIDRQWSSGSLEDNKRLSKHWKPTQNATIKISPEKQ
jgi:hypothetical protein